MRINGLAVGELDSKIEIETPTLTNHAVTGEQIKSWASFGFVWGKRLKTSAEKFEGDQQVAIEETKWLTRWVSGLNETMRFKISGVYYYIKGIDEADRKVSMIVRTEKRNNV